MERFLKHWNATVENRDLKKFKLPFQSLKKSSTNLPRCCARVNFVKKILSIITRDEKYITYNQASYFTEQNQDIGVDSSCTENLFVKAFFVSSL